MAEKSIGKITQVISAVLDIKFPQGGLPEINDAIEITRKDGDTLVVEVAQHLGDDTVRCIALEMCIRDRETKEMKPETEELLKKAIEECKAAR